MKIFWQDGDLVPFDMSVHALYRMLVDDISLVREKDYANLAELMDNDRVIFKHPDTEIPNLKNHEAYIVSDTFYLENIAKASSNHNTHVIVSSIINSRNDYQLAFMCYVDSDYVKSVLRKIIIDEFLADNI